MSDVSQGPGWWQASDGRWYPPTARPGTSAGPGPGPGPSPYGGAGYGPPPGYGYPYAPNPYGTPTGLPSVSGMAIASMVLGIIAAVPCCSINHVGALVGLPLGIIALMRINKGAADPRGKGQAIAGIVLCSVGIAIGILAIVLLVISANNDPYSLGIPGTVS